MDNEIYYGVPEQKKFPLDSRAHVKSAIRFFNYVEPKYEKELARRLATKIREYGIEVTPSEDNRFYKYYKPKHERTMDENSNHLAHYGVLGMKWGVRKNPTRAFTKTYKKAEKLNRQADKYDLKGKKLNHKGLKKQSRARTEKEVVKGAKIQLKGDKLIYKAEKKRQKADKWTKKVKVVFAKNNLDYDQMIAARQKGMSFAEAVTPYLDKALDKGAETVVTKGADRIKKQ